MLQLLAPTFNFKSELSTASLNANLLGADPRGPIYLVTFSLWEREHWGEALALHTADLDSILSLHMVYGAPSALES